MKETKRLFFGFEIHAPWPEDFPEGRILAPSSRHMTLAFLGHVPFNPLQEALKSFPEPPFKVGQSGYFDHVLFLPNDHPRVVAWHMKFLNEQLNLNHYYKDLIVWLKTHQFRVDEFNHFLPHLTLSRAPFETKDWEDSFSKLPWIMTHLHLYESLGHLNYQSCWTYPLKFPFEELEHTADIAFRIRGETIQALFHNAFTALAFNFPPLLSYSAKMAEIHTFDEIVYVLNGIIGQADSEIGCPFKAVSYHGNLHQEEDKILLWDMIVDV